MPGFRSTGHAQAALCTTNALLTVLIVALIVMVWRLPYAVDHWIAEFDVERYTDVAKARLELHADEIEAELEAVAGEALPPIRQAVRERARRDYPLYVEALETQGQVYVDNLQKIAAAELKQQYRDYLRAHRAVLREEFPEHASEENVERVLARFEATYNRLVDRYYIEQFQEEADQTRDLWARFEPAPQPGPNEPSLQEQLADYVADWTALTLAQDDVATAAR